MPPALVDGDRDGVVAAADCDDSRAAVRPGAVDVPGNRIDEDCAGGDAAFPLVPATIAFGFLGFRDGTVVETLTVRDLPPGGRAELRCEGKGCKLARKAVRVSRRGTVGAGQAARRAAPARRAWCSRCGRRRRASWPRCAGSGCARGGSSPCGRAFASRRGRSGRGAVARTARGARRRRGAPTAHREGGCCGAGRGAARAAGYPRRAGSRQGGRWRRRLGREAVVEALELGAGGKVLDGRERLDRPPVLPHDHVRLAADDRVLGAPPAHLAGELDRQVPVHAPVPPHPVPLLRDRPSLRRGGGRPALAARRCTVLFLAAAFAAAVIVRAALTPPIEARCGLSCARRAAVAQLARASACHAEGRGFESLQPLVAAPGSCSRLGERECCHAALRATLS